MFAVWKFFFGWFCLFVLFEHLCFIGFYFVSKCLKSSVLPASKEKKTERVDELLTGRNLRVLKGIGKPP